MPRLFAALVRHGAYHQPEGVPSALLPHPLTDAGRAAAAELGRTLAARERAGEFTIHGAIDASSLRRAWETATVMAEALAQALGRPFVVDAFDALAERSLGAFANLSVAEIERIVADDPRYPPLPPGWKAMSSFRAPAIGAESLMEAGARAAAHIEARLQAIAPILPGESLKIFVGHGAGLRHAALALGTLTLAEIPGLSMHHCRPVILEREDVGRYRHAGGAWKVRKAGEVARD